MEDHPLRLSQGFHTAQPHQQQGGSDLWGLGQPYQHEPSKNKQFLVQPQPVRVGRNMVGFQQDPVCISSKLHQTWHIPVKYFCFPILAFSNKRSVWSLAPNQLYSEAICTSWPINCNRLFPAVYTWLTHTQLSFTIQTIPPGTFVYRHTLWERAQFSLTEKIYQWSLINVIYFRD